MVSQHRLPLCSHSVGSARDAVYRRLPKLKEGNGIHTLTQERLNELPVFKANYLIHMYVRRGSMLDAHHVFDSIPNRNVVSWNIMILGYAKQEEGGRALELYAQMHQEGFQPDDQTCISALKACSSLAALEDGKQVDWKSTHTECLAKGRTIHSQVINNGFELNVSVGNILMNMYAKCRSMQDAQRVYDELPHHNVVTWNTMILGYAEQEECGLALEMYAQMQQKGVQPNDRTFVCALKACGLLAALEEDKQGEEEAEKLGCLVKGRAIHAQVVKSGYELDAFLGTTLVTMYVKCGSMEDACCVFDNLSHRKVAAWNSMIMGYIEQEEYKAAFQLYARVEVQGLLPSIITFVAILKACGNTGALESGKELHSQISQVGLESNAMLATSLIHMYSKCGSVTDAQQLFDGLPKRQVQAWTALITGYACQGRSGPVFHLFDSMRQEGIQPDGVTFLSVLTVCSHVGLVEKSQDYFHVMRNQYGIIPTIEHYTCMVDLLGRAGRVDDAVAMVEMMPLLPNIVIWLTVLDACRKLKSVKVGRHAFENIVALDENTCPAYVLMANTHTDPYMQEDTDKIEAKRDCSEMVH